MISFKVQGSPSMPFFVFFGVGDCHRTVEIHFCPLSKEKSMVLPIYSPLLQIIPKILTSKLIYMIQLLPSLLVTSIFNCIESAIKWTDQVIVFQGLCQQSKGMNMVNFELSIQSFIQSSTYHCPRHPSPIRLAYSSQSSTV